MLRRIERILLFSSPVVIVVFLTLSSLLISYLNLRFTEVLSYISNDGWCNFESQGIGDHCFGDFYQLLGNNFGEWPTLNQILLLPFKTLLTLHFFSPRLPLVIYLTLCLIAISLIPLVLFYQKKISSESAKSSALLLFCSLPILGALDRGNAILFCVPLLYAFFNSIERNSFRTTILSFFLVGLKPHFLLLALYVAKKKGIRHSLNWLATMSSTWILSIIVFAKFNLAVIGRYFEFLWSYQEYTAPGVIYPANLSATNTVFFLSKILVGEPFSFPTVRVAVYLSLFVFFIMFVIGMKYLSDNLTIIYLLSFLICFPGTSFYYYSALLLVPFLRYFFEMESAKSHGFQNSNEHRNVQFFTTTSIFSIYLFLVPIGIPLSLIFPQFVEVVGKQVTPSWIVGQTFLLLNLVLLSFYSFAMKIRDILISKCGDHS